MGKRKPWGWRAKWIKHNKCFTNVNNVKWQQYKNVKMCDIKRSAQICWDLSRSAQICRDLPRYVESNQDIMISVWYCETVKLSQYQMSCVIRVCRLTQRIDCVLIFSIFYLQRKLKTTLARRIWCFPCWHVLPNIATTILCKHQENKLLRIQLVVSFSLAEFGKTYF